MGLALLVDNGTSVRFRQTGPFHVYVPLNLEGHCAIEWLEYYAMKPNHNILLDRVEKCISCCGNGRRNVVSGGILCIYQAGNTAMPP